MRVAIVHDWLYTLGGAEKVLSGILRCFPQADLYTIFDVLTADEREAARLPPSRCSFLQRAPAIERRHRLYIPLMCLAIEQFDLSGYDVVISSSHAVAKGVLTGPDQLHVAYVHSPMRYAWDLQHQYLREAGLARGVRSWLARYLLHKLRLWDYRTGAGVDCYVANSHFVAARIRKIYGRSATVIHPPVGTPDVLAPRPAIDEPFYLAASRLVPYKNISAIVKAFATMPDRRLVVAGTGPELKRLQALGGPNVSFVGHVSDERLRLLMRTAQALVFAAEEDFGIMPLEAQGEGTPVIALGRGGARETVRTGGAHPTGLFFAEPSPEAIVAAIETFEAQRTPFTRAACHGNARAFSAERFESEFSGFVHAQYRAFRDRAPCLTGGNPRPDPAVHATVATANAA